MWRPLLDLPRPMLALGTVGAEGAPPAHHYGSIAAMVLLAIFFVAYAYRCYAESDDRRALLFKLAVTVGLLLLALFLLYISMYHDPRLFLLFLFPAVAIGFMWLPNLIGIMLRPLTSIFDGGRDEVEAKPFYFIAAAKRSKGLHQEAAEEVRKQLEKFPGDVAGSMLLASIQAEDLRDLPGAQTTLNELLQEGHLTPQQRATALHTLADWQLQFGRDSEAARQTLDRLVKAFPDSQFAHAAEQRIATLDGFAATRNFRENARFEVRRGERDLGLRMGPPAEPEAIDAGEQAEQYVRQLEKHPADTDTRENLAVLYAEQFDRLDLAADQLEQLIAMPEETAKHVAHWLNLLATLYARVGHDEANARRTLLRIAEKFPGSSHAEIATRRLANLRNEIKSVTPPLAKRLGAYEKDIGLKRPAG